MGKLVGNWVKLLRTDALWEQSRMTGYVLSTVPAAPGMVLVLPLGSHPPASSSLVHSFSNVISKGGFLHHAL
jgi:hypothetical protein